MKMSMRFLVSGSVCALLALGCVLLFEDLGASVDAQGLLHEPFGLIPLAWLFLSRNSILVSGTGARRAFSRKRLSRETGQVWRIARIPGRHFFHHGSKGG
jgi:hypothetical protein